MNRLDRDLGCLVSVTEKPTQRYYVLHPSPLFLWVCLRDMVTRKNLSMDAVRLKSLQTNNIRVNIARWISIVDCATLAGPMALDGLIAKLPKEEE